MEEHPVHEAIRDKALIDAERALSRAFDPEVEDECDCIFEAVQALAQAADAVLRLRPTFQGPRRYGGAADILHLLAGVLDKGQG